MADVSKRTELSIRTWSPEIVGPPAAAGDLRHLSPRTGARPAPRDSRWAREGRSDDLMIGNREACRGLAEQFDVPWFNIGDEPATPAAHPMTIA